MLVFHPLPGQTGNTIPGSVVGGGDHIYIYICMCRRLFVYVYMYVFVCICTCTCIYTHAFVYENADVYLGMFPLILTVLNRDESPSPSRLDRKRDH